MGYETIIQQLLLSPAVQEINFRLRNIEISAHAFRLLAMEHFNVYNPNRIKIVFNQSRLRAGHPQAEGGYDDDGDTLILKSEADLSNKRLLVHELTHIQSDYRGFDNVLRLDEAAAFLAMDWYHLASGGSFSNSHYDRNLLPILTELRNKYLSTRRLVALSNQQINFLLQNVRHDYPCGRYLYNGIRGSQYSLYR
jgi:hypothetical protein